MTTPAILLLCALPAFAPIAPVNPCSERVYRVAMAVKRMEGVRIELNNPGGLTYRGRLLRFPSYARGETRMLKLLEKHRRHSARRLMKRWAPDSALWYAAYVAERAGVPIDAPICEGE